jgi:BASS family bile acid:Na+ symporter
MTLLLGALAWSVRVMIFALGLRARWTDVIFLWRQPGLLLRSLLAMYIVIPVFAVMMVKALELPQTTRVAVLVIAISAGAPLVPRRLLQSGGDPRYVLSLAVTSSVLAIATVPLSVAALALIFGVKAGVDPSAVAALVAKSFLVPFLAGVAVHAARPAIAARVVAPLTAASLVVLAVCLTIALGFSIGLVIENGLRSFLALASLTLVAILAGHLLGGPKLEDRVSLGVLCATRHVGLVMMIALALVPSRGALAAISAYVLAALVVSTPYVMWNRRRLQAGTVA